jgi:hypothetical protein
MATPQQEVIERKASTLETAYDRVDENYVVSQLIDRIKKVNWELRHTEIVKILQEIRKMKEPELTDYINYLKEAVTRFHLFPELNAAAAELRDSSLLSKLRRQRTG